MEYNLLKIMNTGNQVLVRFKVLVRFSSSCSRQVTLHYSEQGSYRSCKVQEFKCHFSRPKKSWNQAQILEIHGNVKR